jgi:hypothetical protein
MIKTKIFSVTSKPPPIPTPASSSLNKIPKPPPPPTFLSNSTTNPGVMTTQLPTVKTRAASEPKESATNLKHSSPVPAKRLTPTPPPPPSVLNGHKKKTTPPGSLSQQKAPSPEKVKPTINKPLQSSIFVPPPTIPNGSNIRIAANVEIGRLEIEDLAGKELNSVYESYINDLIEEVIQSDFEKPSIPEVILAVITDLTNDDDNHQNTDQQHLNDFSKIYNFSQNKARSTSPIITNNNNNTNGTNGDIDHYYKRVHQAIATVNGVNNHGSIRSTNSSSQSIGLTSSTDPTSNYLQVQFFFKISLFFINKNMLFFSDSSNTSSYYSNDTTICWTRW